MLNQNKNQTNAQKNIPETSVQQFQGTEPCITVIKDSNEDLTNTTLHQKNTSCQEQEVIDQYGYKENDTHEVKNCTTPESRAILGVVSRQGKSNMKENKNQNINNASYQSKGKLMKIENASYCRIKSGTKQPIGKNWQLNTYNYTQITAYLENGEGYGIVYGSGFSGLDIDNPEAALRFIKHFGCHPYEYPAISWTSGKRFDGTYSDQVGPDSNITVLFRNSPEDQVDLTHRIPAYNNTFDIRTGLNQSVLPSNSVHPGTGKPYYWVNSPDTHQPGLWGDKLNALIDDIEQEKEANRFFGLNSKQHKVKSLELREKNLERLKLTGRHNPVTFMEYVIEPYFSNHPELLYDGSEIYDHKFIRQGSSRLAGDPIWRQSSSGKSLIITAQSAKTLDNLDYTRWVWVDFGIDIGGTAIAYRHYITGNTTRRPTRDEGWSICEYYVRKLKSYGVQIDLPGHAKKRGVFKDHINKVPFVDDAAFVPSYSTVDLTRDNNTLDYIETTLLEHNEGDDNSVCELSIDETVDITEVYKIIHELGVKYIHDGRATGTGKTHTVAYMGPWDFNRVNSNGDIESPVQHLIYLHPHMHLNPSVDALKSNYTLMPVRHGGLKPDATLKLKRATDPNDREISVNANCIRDKAFTAFNANKIPIPIVDANGGKVNQLCKSCPIQKQCRSGRGDYTYRHDKFKSRNQPRLRMSPNSLTDAYTMQASDRGGFKYSNSVGIFDEISQFELLETRVLKNHDIPESVDKFYATIAKINARIAKQNEDLKLESQLPEIEIPEAIRDWLTELFEYCRPSVGGKQRYGLSSDHEIFTKDLDLPPGFNLDNFINRLSIAITQSFEYWLEDNTVNDVAAIDIDFNQTKNLYSVKNINHIGVNNAIANLHLFDARLILDIIRIRFGSKQGSLSLEPTKKRFSKEDLVGYNIVITNRNRRLIDVITSEQNGFQMSVFLDATESTHDIARKLDVSPKEIVRIVQKQPKPENIDIVQVTGLGRLGMNRGEDIKKRLDAVVKKIRKNHADLPTEQIGEMDFKHFRTLADEQDHLKGVWGRDSVGSNNFEKCKILIIKGIMTPNINTLIRDFAITHAYTPSKEQEFVEREIKTTNYEQNKIISRQMESVDPLFRYHTRCVVNNVFDQCIGRLRANRRPDEELTIYFISDYATEHTVTLLDAAEITPDAAAKKDRSDIAIANFIMDYQSDNPETEKLTHAIIAAGCDVSNARVGKFVHDCFDYHLSPVNEQAFGKKLRALIIKYNLVNKALKNKNYFKDNPDVLHQVTDELVAKKKKYSADEIEEITREKAEDKLNRLNSEPVGPVDIGLQPDQKVPPELGKALAYSVVEPAKKKSDGLTTRLKIQAEHLDIYANAEYEIKPFQPMDVTPFDEIKAVMFDIETVALEGYRHLTNATNPEISRVTHVGFGWKKDGEFHTHIITDNDERVVLQKTLDFLRVLWRKGLKVLVGHNIHDFDLRYMMFKWQHNNMKHPFTEAETTRNVPNTASDGTKDFEIREKFWCGRGNKWNPDVNIIDTMFMLARDDFQKRRLPNRGLKAGGEAFGRKEDRIELNFKVLEHLWYGERHVLEQYRGIPTSPINTEGLDLDKGVGLIEEYLIDDLEDTQLLYENLAPAFYYQLMYVPNTSYQHLIVTGQASKWNKILRHHYGFIRKNYDMAPDPDHKPSYDGAYTDGYTGLHRNVAKIDISSMYPSIMIKYGITSYKDSDKFFLSVLKYLKDTRIKHKKMGKTGDINAKYMSESEKILINSGYGMLGTSGINFNDPRGAVLVTAYGRVIIKNIQDSIRSYPGATICETDTDGVIFALPDHCTKEHFEEVYNLVKSNIPDGIEVDGIEYYGNGVYIPHREGSHPDDENGTGQRKNYVVIHGVGEKPTIKGLYRKRDRCKLEKDFAVEWLNLYFTKGEEAAEEYYKETRKQINSGTMPITQLMQSKNVSVKDVEFSVKLGIAEKGTKVTYWVGKYGIKTTNIADGYSKPHYLGIIDDTVNAFKRAKHIGDNGFEPTEQQPFNQLSLFPDGI